MSLKEALQKAGVSTQIERIEKFGAQIKIATEALEGLSATKLEGLELKLALLELSMLGDNYWAHQISFERLSKATRQKVKKIQTILKKNKSSEASIILGACNRIADQVKSEHTI